MNKEYDKKQLNKAIIIVVICLLLAFVAAYFVAPYFIDYYYGSQPAHTISETIPQYPSEGSNVLVLTGTIHCDNCDISFSPMPYIFTPSLWLEDLDGSRINISLNELAEVPLLDQRIKVIGYYQRTEADFGLTGMYEFVPKRILKISK